MRKLLTSIPRFMRWVVGAGLGACAIGMFQFWVPDDLAARTASAGWTATPFGPLGPADRDLLEKVRLAGLWEMPTGQQLQQRGDSERVREIGRLISTEHVELDRIVCDAAGKLDVALPDQPSQEQQGWMAEISALSGPAFDKVAINRLRAAHGKVLPIIAQVRSGTRNTVVRQLAVSAAEFVNRHQTYLESSGLVNFAALPEPPRPASAGPSNGVRFAGAINGMAVLVILAALQAMVGLLVAYLRRSRQRGRHLAAFPVAPEEERDSRHDARRW